MFKYIVTWVLTSYFSVPCITPEPKPDEYGRMPQANMMLSVACMDSKSDTLTKVFYSRDSAIVFINKGQQKDFSFTPIISYELSDFKLDSIKIKK